MTHKTAVEDLAEINVALSDLTERVAALDARIATGDPQPEPVDAAPEPDATPSAALAPEEGPSVIWNDGVPVVRAVYSEPVTFAVEYGETDALGTARRAQTDLKYAAHLQDIDGFEGDVLYWHSRAVNAAGDEHEASGRSEREGTAEEPEEPVVDPTPDPKPEPSPTPEPNPGTASALTARLDAAKDVVVIEGDHDEKYEVEAKEGRVFDARRARFSTDKARHGAIELRGAPDMVWVGGEVRSSRPWDASWADHKATEDSDDPSRNSAGIDNYCERGVVCGLYADNTGDPFRANNAEGGWVIEDCWATYSRDDGIENDNLHPGRVARVLLDGVYTAFSLRPSSSNTSSRANGAVIEISECLVRLQAQPYPYKWESKSGVINDKGEPYKKGDGIPYGHGNFFKYDEDEVPGRNVRYDIQDSVFVGSHNTVDGHFNFPDESLIDTCKNNVVVWLGKGDFPGRLPKSGFRVVTGDEGRKLWKERVVAWHREHPDVGAAHKPTNPGEIVWPQKF